MSEIADRWASGTAYEAYVGRWSARVAPVFLDWLGVPAERRWVDVGCGTGMLTRAILERRRPASVVGVDPSPGFIDHARAAVKDPRAAFRVGTAAATGLADGEVDAVVSGLVLTFVPDVNAALAEARRVVRGEGVVAAYVWDYAEGMQMMRRFWDAARALDPKAEALDEGRRFSVGSRDVLVGIFRDAGLETVDVRAIDIPTVFRDFGDFWTPFLGGTGPGPSYVASMSGESRATLRDRLHASLPVEADGSIQLTARAWAVRGQRDA